MDERILAITSRDIVAAEAHYHKSCYKGYTRTKPEKSDDNQQEEDPYQKVEKAAKKMLSEFIRNDLFNKPRILPFTELTSKVITFMNQKGIYYEVTDATKKHLRRKLEAEFGEALHFFTISRLVYLRPDNLSYESVINENVLLKNKLQAYTQNDDFDCLIVKIAQFLRHEIKCEIPEQTWPPHPQELSEGYLPIPDNLMKFLYILLCGKEQTPTLRVNRLSWSIALDIISGVTVCKVLTPKHVLLPLVVKTLTGNVELIKTLKRLGHSCSYSVLVEIDTALCLEKLENTDNNRLPLPSDIHPGVPTVLAFDNIDRQEEVLSGAGTSHRVNGIIVQAKSMTCAPPKPQLSISKKDKKRTIRSSDIPLPVYTAGKRNGPAPVTPADLSEVLKDAAWRAQRRNILFIIERAQDPTNQTVSSWTGFNILTRDNIPVASDTVGYLPTINAPATEMTTV
ncbi:uncharacterized protein LOC135222086 [Macrobrachium nipponense]|uniref:uncharacterized protein LOC135222086 n=1 Tax=Macrobrachium nipponense TaxID=159736 RepID=UPI0030C8141F